MVLQLRMNTTSIAKFPAQTVAVSKSAAVLYSEVGVPMLQDMLKMFHMDSDTFSTLKQIVVHML
jgi:hypothetical protein